MTHYFRTKLRTCTALLQVDTSKASSMPRLLHQLSLLFHEYKDMGATWDMFIESEFSRSLAEKLAEVCETMRDSDECIRVVEAMATVIYLCDKYPLFIYQMFLLDMYMSLMKIIQFLVATGKHTHTAMHYIALMNKILPIMRNNPLQDIRDKKAGMLSTVYTFCRCLDAAVATQTGYLADDMEQYLESERGTECFLALTYNILQSRINTTFMFIVELVEDDTTRAAMDLSLVPACLFRVVGAQPDLCLQRYAELVRKHPRFFHDTWTQPRNVETLVDGCLWKLCDATAQRDVWSTITNLPGLPKLLSDAALCRYALGDEHLDRRVRLLAPPNDSPDSPECVRLQGLYKDPPQHVLAQVGVLRRVLDSNAITRCLEHITLFEGSHYDILSNIYNMLVVLPLEQRVYEEIQSRILYYCLTRNAMLRHNAFFMLKQNLTVAELYAVMQIVAMCRYNAPCSSMGAFDRAKLRCLADMFHTEASMFVLRHVVARHTCPICLDLDEGSVFCRLHCGHVFHTLCVVRWLAINNVSKNLMACPVCRDQGVKMVEIMRGIHYETCGDATSIGRTPLGVTSRATTAQSINSSS